MKFTAEEARAVTIELVSKKLGEDKIKLIIEEIREQAQSGYSYLNIHCDRFKINNNLNYLVGLWAEFNGYKVSYPRPGVVTIDWRNI